MKSAPRAARAEHDGDSRTRRLIVVGMVMGFMAALLIALAGAALVAALAALVRTGFGQAADDWRQTETAIRVGLTLVASLTVAGAAAGFLAAWTRATDRVDRRAVASSIGAGLSWAMVMLALERVAPSDIARPTPLLHSAIGLTAAALIVGAIVSVALWPSVVRAVAAQRARGVMRSAWAGAHRLAAFGFALVASLAAAPLLVVSIVALFRAVGGGLPRSAWTASAAMLVATVLALCAAVLGLRLAGVPRRMPRTTRQRP